MSMRFISHYEEYPSYEPAEGGYYYAGNQLVASERKSKRQCRRNFEKIWQDCLKENEQNGFVGNDYDEWAKIIGRLHVYPWIRANANYIYRNGILIGSGESYTIERKQGSQEKGWEPYC
mgnify:FL=1